MRERFWIVILFLALGGGLSFLYLSQAERIYEATAIIRYEAGNSSLPNLQDLSRSVDYGRQFDLGRLEDYSDLALSDAVMQAVIEAESLESDQEFLLGLTLEEVRTLSVLDALKRRVQVEAPPEQRVLLVTVEHRSPEMAARLANAFALALVEEDVAVAGQRLENELAGLDELFKVLSTEQSLTGSTAKESLTELAELGAEQERLERAATELNQAQIRATLQVVGLRQECQAATQAGTNVSALLRIALVSSDPEVAGLRAGVTDAELAFEAVQTRYKQKHPNYLAAEEEVNRANAQILEAADRAVERARNRLVTAERQEAELRSQLETNRMESRALGRQLLESPDTVLQARASFYSTLTDRVLDWTQKTSLERGLLSTPLTLAQQARVPTRAARPNDLLVGGAGLSSGLIAGLLLAFFMGLTDSSFKSLDEAEQALSLPVITAVPRVPKLEDRLTQCIITDEGFYPAAEAFRSLRTSLSVLRKGALQRSVLVTSASPQEGKTFCALNLAVSFAQQGHRTLLLECDLRRPMAAASVPGIRQNAPGLANFLKERLSSLHKDRTKDPKAKGESLSFSEWRQKQEGVESGKATQRGAPVSEGEREGVSGAGLTLGELAQKTSVEDLYFLPAGSAASNSSELLGQPGILANVMRELVRRYDRVILDAPPLLGVSDALLLAAEVDAVCLIVRANRTPRKMAQRAIDMLKRAEAPLVGIALNGLSPNQSSYYKESYGYAASARPRKR